MLWFGEITYTVPWVEDIIYQTALWVEDITYNTMPWVKDIP